MVYVYYFFFILTTFYIVGAIIIPEPIPLFQQSRGVLKWRALTRYFQINRKRIRGKSPRVPHIVHQLTKFPFFSFIGLEQWKS